MKFIDLLLSLTISTLFFANSINFLKLIKRDVIYNEEAFLNNLSKECRTEYEISEYYNKCMSDITLVNYKNSFSDTESEKCKIFFSDPLKYFPSCQNIPEFKEIFHPAINKTYQQSNKIFCQTNEEGELCPYSLSMMTKGGSINVLLDQCKSKKCTESLLEIFNNISIDQFTVFENSTYTTGNFNYNELNLVNQYISILESKKSQYLHVTSNASHINIDASLLIFLVILLLLIF